MFSSQEFQESATIGQKRPKVGRIFHHNTFSALLRVLGLKAAQVLFFTMLISFFVFYSQEFQETGTFGQQRPKVCRIFHHNSFSAHLLVLGLKAHKFFFLTILISFFVF